MAYGDIQTTVSVLLAFAAAVGVVAGCVAAFVKLYSWATKPHRESAHHAAEIDVCCRFMLHLRMALQGL